MPILSKENELKFTYEASSTEAKSEAPEKTDETITNN